ncbi:hypothetical protein EDB19DRAFT_1781542, partial [Suillus lakei]
MRFKSVSDTISNFIIPIPIDQMEKTTLGKCLARRVAHYASFVTSSTQIENALAKIYAGIFSLAESELSTYSYSNSAVLLSMLSGECI